jgi:serine/threonine-protein kinase
LRRRIDHIRQLGQYTLEEKIGEGGWGEVYRARHAMLRRPTAIKLIKPDVISPETITCFEREVQLTAQLTCAHTIDIYDFGRAVNGVFYYAMEYLPGVTLDRLIRMETTIPPARVVHILQQVCESLAEAHDIGLIHRDIKPPNIMLCRKGMKADFVKVLDFGLARELAVEENSGLPAPQVIHGTPLYIAPERLLNAPVIDARSDIYSLGVVAFNLLTGKDVFTGRSSVELCHHVMHTPPPKIYELTDTVIPAGLCQLVHDCLEKAPDRRPASISEVLSVIGSLDLRPWTDADAARWWKDKNP